MCICYADQAELLELSLVWDWRSGVWSSD